MNYLKQALMELLSGLTTKKNEKEIWSKDLDGNPITVESIDDENYIVRYYYSTGKLYREECYKGCVLFGRSRCWCNDGKLIWDAGYKNNLLHGVYKAWKDNGKLWWEEIWVDGGCVKKVK